MPTMANITVKRADGVTDVTYSALSGSGGDTSPAVWRQDIGNGNPMGMRPMLRVWTKFNGPRTARVLDAEFVLPVTYVETDTGLTKELARIPFKLNAVLPLNITNSALAEAVQGVNLLSSLGFKDVVWSGYAPT